MLGHSYLFDLARDLLSAQGVGEPSEATQDAELSAWVTHHWNHHILPQLAETLVANHQEDQVHHAGQGVLAVRVGGRAILSLDAAASHHTGLPNLQLAAAPPSGSSPDEQADILEPTDASGSTASTESKE